jgi:hypothetical protein
MLDRPLAGRTHCAGQHRLFMVVEFHHISCLGGASTDINLKASSAHGQV